VIKDYAARYRAAAEKAGRKPHICLMRDAIVADNMAAAEAASEPTMYTHRFYFQYGAYVPDEYFKDVKKPEDMTFAQTAKDRLIVGSPDDCLEQLLHWKEEIQPDYLIIRLRQPGGPSHENTLNAIRTFGEKVIPKL
jgi:alkanesulfonate monooxygenase SsuD/methylene tetrahydromethanopterin reductase-like flavin-dependent oxidoreductase (luciferase family)